MKTLKDYIAESETWVGNPTQGDEFDIELAPDHNFESYVVESTEDGVVLYADNKAMSLLESYGCFEEEEIDEEIRRYGAVGSSPGMGYTLPEGTFRDEDGDDDEDNLDEGRMKDIATMASDADYMRDSDFLKQYGMSKEAFKMKYKDLLPKASNKPADPFGRMMELAGCGSMEEGDCGSMEEDNSDLLPKEVDLAPVGALEEEEVDIDEAEYRGRKVPLGKPMRGDVKKFKVYVKDPATGNVKKVNFGHGGTSAKRAGQKTMKIKKSNPARRKSFRARHNCDNPGPRTKARYWSCRAW